MSKKGMTAEALVMIVFLLVTLLVFLTIWFTAYRESIKQAAEGDEQCSMELLFRSMIQSLTFSLTDVPVKCAVKKIIVTNDQIERQRTLAKQATLSSSLPDYPATTQGENKWIASRIIADEMVSCYNRGWKGRLALSPHDERSWKEMMGQRLQEGVDNHYLCFLCARISFNPDTSINQIEKYQLSPWLKNNYIQGQSYYDYLSRPDENADSNPLDEIMIEPSQTVAVLFAYPANGNAFIYSVNYKDVKSFVRTETIHIPGAPYPTTQKGKCIDIIGDI